MCLNVWNIFDFSPAKLLCLEPFEYLMYWVCPAAPCGCAWVVPAAAVVEATEISLSSMMVSWCLLACLLLTCRSWCGLSLSPPHPPPTLDDCCCCCCWAAACLWPQDRQIGSGSHFPQFDGAPSVSVPGHQIWVPYQSTKNTQFRFVSVVFNGCSPGTWRTSAPSVARLACLEFSVVP